MYNVTHSSVRHDSFVCLSWLVARAIFVLEKKVFPQRNFPLPKKYLQGHYRRDWKSAGQPVCTRVEKHGKHFITWYNTTSRAAEQDDKIGKLGPKSEKLCRMKYTPSAARPLVAKIDPRICKGIIWTYMSLSLAYTQRYTITSHTHKHVCLCERIMHLFEIMRWVFATEFVLVL